tara:strand:+ start:1044 stop:1250 length:207 start_codon:yes stop_codon:yes gene_type:complete
LLIQTKTILIEKVSKDLIEICKKFQYNSGSSNAEVKTLLKEIAILWDTEEKISSGLDNKQLILFKSLK